MEIIDIVNLLGNTPYEQFIGHFQQIKLKEFVYENIFQIGNDKIGYYSLKIRDKTKNKFCQLKQNLKESTV
jgi:hypothetical protein